MKPNQNKRRRQANKQKQGKPQPPAAQTAAKQNAAQKTPEKGKAPRSAKPSAPAPEKAASKPHIPVRQPKPQPPAPLPRKTARHTAAALFAALLCTGLLTVWFAQNSINAYWQQTYHRPGPLEHLNGFGWWRSGAALKESADGRYRAFRDWFAAQEQTRETDRSPPVPSAQTPPVAAETNVKPPSATVKPLESSTPDPYKVRLSAGDKVFFAGDSMMEGIAPYLQRRLRSEYGIESLNLSRQSTGLSYPQFFDWPAAVEQHLRDDPSIKLVVVFLGPNDPWDFPNPQQPGSRNYLKFQSPEWEQVYRGRIRRIADAAQAADVGLIWLGIPLMKGSRLNGQMRYLDRLMADELKGRALWLPTDRLLGGSPDGTYSDSITHNGQPLRVRSKDGIHFTLKGQQFLADHVAAHIEFHAAPAPSAASAP